MKGDKFEEGQLVYCIINTHHSRGLTLGKGYMVEWVGGDVDEEWIGVKNDKGQIAGYYTPLFSDLKPEEGSIKNEATHRCPGSDEGRPDKNGNIGYVVGDEYLTPEEYAKRQLKQTDEEPPQLEHLIFDPRLYDTYVSEDAVNHPPHYTKGGIECIDALEAATSEMTGWKATLTYQIMKYMWRWPFKAKSVEDLKKAQFYLERLIKKVEEEK